MFESILCKKFGALGEPPGILIRARMFFKMARDCPESSGKRLRTEKYFTTRGCLALYRTL